jgi:ribonuclease BN (tRNA processing enzyme)
MTTISLRVIGTSAVAFAGETTCLLLSIGSRQILIDAGTNSSYELNRLGISTLELDAVFLSHVHADHMQGLPALLFTRSVQARARQEPVPPLTLVGNAQVLDSAQDVLRTVYPDREFEIERQESLTWDTVNGVLTLQPFPVHHTVPCEGFVLSLDGEPLVGFTGDTAPFPELGEHLRNVKLLVVECFGTQSDFGPVIETTQHLSAEAANALVRDIQPVAAVPFHMHAPYGKAGAALTALHAVLQMGVDDHIWRFVQPGHELQLEV